MTTVSSTAIYVINRRCDTDRLAQFTASAAGFGLEFERIAAFDGHDPMAPFFLYRDLRADEFWGKDAIKPGAFACYLSHIAVWRRLLASDHQMALICENDAVFSQSPNALFSEAEDLGSFDVILANERALEWRHAAIDGAGLVTASDVLVAMGAKGIIPGEHVAKAPGADCYLISREGAGKLLTYVREDKIIAGVDWMLLRRSLDVDGLAGDEWAYLSEAATDGDLQTYITDLAVAGQGSGSSVLSHKSEISIAELKSQRAIGENGLSQAKLGDELDPVFSAFEKGDVYEAPGLELMRRWMPEDGVFIDIGAHAGGHTLFMLRHGGVGRAIPFEFNVRANRFLNEMVKLNGLRDRVDLEHLGVGLAEERGKQEAFGSKKNLSNNRLREGFVEKINTRPADVLLREADVDMIKIDVGGDERDVLKGLRKTIKRKRPILALDLTRPKLKKALPLVERLGYVERERVEWHDAEGDRIVAIFTTHPRIEMNVQATVET